MTYPAELFDLTDRVVLITGGSRGLGREMALAAARCGADVVIASRKYDSCVATAEEITAATGRRAFAYAVHVGRWDELDGLVDAVYAEFGRVDVLVNNAGMSPLYDKLSDVTEKLFDAVTNLNLKGPFRLSALVGERMVADGGGAIINVSTHGSLRPHPSFIPYAAAKAGLNAMTEGLALAFGPTVRASPPRSSAPHCSSCRMRRVSPPVRFCAPTVEASDHPDSSGSGDVERGVGPVQHRSQ